MSRDDQHGKGDYRYDFDGTEKRDDRRAKKARDLARAGIDEEARRVAGRIEHYKRRLDILDEVRRRAE